MLDQPRVPLTVMAQLTQGSFALDVSWQGDCRLLGLFGPSGSGKTTLLEVIAGLRRPRHARIVVSDRVLADTAAGTHTHVRDRGINVNRINANSAVEQTRRFRRRGGG